MKKFLLSLVMVVAAATFVFAQETKVEEAKSTDGPKMQLESLVVDYGTIEKNSDPFRTVKFTNGGNEPLIIKSARGNCGCTVPTWPREAIMPGESQEIKIRYSTNRVGGINKKVTLVTNEKENNRHIIKLKGKILKPDNTQGVPSGKETMLQLKK